jgi:2',3'-cyclic-nucleotide 2'-phosphodiesterase (5'-nucleotidase family)
VTSYLCRIFLREVTLTLIYSAIGRIVAFSGAPIHMDNSTAQDTELQAQIDEWRKPFEEYSAEKIGTALVTLEQSMCQKEECTLGDFMADSILSWRRKTFSQADFAIINSGGIRTNSVRKWSHYPWRCSQYFAFRESDRRL